MPQQPEQRAELRASIDQLESGELSINRLSVTAAEQDPSSTGRQLPRLTWSPSLTVAPPMTPPIICCLIKLPQLGSDSDLTCCSGWPVGLIVAASAWVWAYIELSPTFEALARRLSGSFQASIPLLLR